MYDIITKHVKFGNVIVHWDSIENNVFVVADISGTMYSDAADLFGIVGSPMLAIVHPEGEILFNKYI